MNTTGIVYRPPFEANSLLLQVTTGCSHNKCTFCTMYHDVPFSMCPLEQVEADLDEAALFRPDVKRVFLEHGDPFTMPAERLLKIAELIHQKLPKVGTIAMYASIQNIRRKTDAELRRLRDAGINGLDIGVESGLDEALSMMNKGHTAQESIEQLQRLKKAGYDFTLNIILGCAGAELWRENAEATAAMINAVQPKQIFTGTLHAEPGCKLYGEMQSGAFRECTFRQLLDEQELLLSRLELEECYYFSSHPSNVMPMQGWLPKHKQDMLEAVREMRAYLADRLDEIPVRGGEGSILNRE
jgi:radical SAM superfamily enzyme YgiQ (UPF0313 family)